MNIIIVEDDLEAFNILNQYLMRIQEETNQDIRIIHYINAESFLMDTLVKKDLIFMDINLSGMSGIKAALEYRRTNQHAVLIFITNLAKFAIRGYEADALDYIVKPINYYDFAMKVKRAFRKVGEVDDNSLLLTLKDTVKVVKISDINYIETRNHRLIFHLKDEVVDVWGVLNEMEKRLKGRSFSRCNSCFLVNLNKVTEVRGATAMVGQDILLISRRRKKQFMEDLTKFYGEGHE